jgi:hypothetical protein
MSNTVSAFESDNVVTVHTFKTDEEAQEFTLGLATVMVQTVIDLTLRINRLDALLKLILLALSKPLIVFSTIRGYREQGEPLPNGLSWPSRKALYSTLLPSL